MAINQRAGSRLAGGLAWIGCTISAAHAVVLYRQRGTFDWLDLIVAAIFLVLGAVWWRRYPKE
ncbi:MAG TPA: hypothetical protein VFG91_12480 [Woeseiaceae bacterium]|nr:hypothetical protein [Woeseiaceae bacterium]